jgi:uncharacterized protein (TIGR03067 family)
MSLFFWRTDVLLRYLTILALALAVSGCLSKPAAEEEEDEQDETTKSNDDPRLHGSWKVIAAEREGVQEREPMGTELTFASGIITVQHGVDKKQGKYLLDQAGDQTKIDLFVKNENGIEEHERGIWTVKGDRLKLCLAEKDEARPKGFMTVKGQNIYLLVLKRINK